MRLLPYLPLESAALAVILSNCILELSGLDALEYWVEFRVGFWFGFWFGKFGGIRLGFKLINVLNVAPWAFLLNLKK